MVSPNLDALLTSAQSHVPSPGSPPYALGLLLHDASAGRLAHGHPLGALLDCLSEDSALGMFKGLMQVLPGQARRVDHVDLAAWLLERARLVGSSRAIADLERYLNSDRLVLRAVAGVSGIKPDRSHSLGRGVELVPWTDVPESSTKRAVTERFIWGGIMHRPEAAVVREVEVPRLHVAPGEQRPYVLEPIEWGDVTDMLLCLGLFGPTAPALLASWLEPPDWAPVMAGGYSFGPVEGRGYGRAWPADAAAEGPELVATWFALDDSRRAALRVPLQRLNTAMRRHAPVDAAIDLGIALESIFLRDQSDGRGEMTFRLRVRASRWLGSTPEERKSFSQLLGDLYGLRSTAVHQGRVGETVRGRQVTNLLEDGYSFTARALVQLIRHGDPDWDSVTYG